MYVKSRKRLATVLAHSMNRANRGGASCKTRPFQPSPPSVAGVVSILRTRAEADLERRRRWRPGSHEGCAGEDARWVGEQEGGAPGGPIRHPIGRSGMFFSCSVSYRASPSEPLFRQFQSNTRVPPSGNSSAIVALPDLRGAGVVRPPNTSALREICGQRRSVGADDILSRRC